MLLALTAAALFGIGTWMILARRLSRIILGLGLIGHGANLLLLLSGTRGRAPIFGDGDPAEFSDPLPQALVLTAIVIAFAVTMFLLAMAFRSWQLTGRDEVEDDIEDRFIARAHPADEEVVDETLAVRAAEADEP
jgi:multicomponent Na+:H+ antiporter subunit C